MTLRELPSVERTVLLLKVFELLMNAKTAISRGVGFGRAVVLLLLLCVVWPAVAEEEKVWSFTDRNAAFDIFFDSEAFEPRLQLVVRGARLEGMKATAVGRGLLIELPQQPLEQARSFALGSFSAVRAVQFMKYGSGSRISVLPGAAGDLKLRLRERQGQLELEMIEGRVVAQAIPRQEPLFQQWGIETKERILGSFRGDSPSERDASSVSSAVSEPNKVAPQVPDIPRPTFEPKEGPERSRTQDSESETFMASLQQADERNRARQVEILTKVVYHTPSTPGTLALRNPGGRAAEVKLRVAKRSETGEFQGVPASSIFDDHTTVQVPALSERSIALPSRLLETQYETAYQVIVDSLAQQENHRKSYALVLVQPDRGIARIRWERARDTLSLRNEGNISILFRNVRACAGERCRSLPSFRLYPGSRRNIELAQDEELQFEQKLQYVASEAKIPRADVLEPTQ